MGMFIEGIMAMFIEECWILRWREEGVATEHDVEKTSGRTYQSDWTEKEDAIDRTKWRNGIH